MGLKFIDSFAFLDKSLDQLVKNLRNDQQYDDKYFVNLRKHFSHLSSQQLKLLLRKGVYPYEYMNSHDKFNEICLPTQDWYSCNKCSNAKHYLCWGS